MPLSVRTRLKEINFLSTVNILWSICYMDGTLLTEKHSCAKTFEKPLMSILYRNVINARLVLQTKTASG